MNDIEAEMLNKARNKANKNVRKATAQRNLSPLLTTSNARVSNDLLSPRGPEESVADTLTIQTTRKKGKKKK